MAFSDFKNINMVIEKYPLRIKREKFLPDTKSEPPDWFIENLNFAIEKKPISSNEFFYCEVFIYPFLQEAWKQHKKLQLWSHQPLHYNDELCGEPDYLISYIPDEVISKIINKPLLAVAEAKKEKFTEGWGQCLAEMIACQCLNEDENMTIYGIVTTGEFWQFGKLEGKVFTEHILPASIDNPEKLFGILDYIFGKCEQQVN
ncbi:MAG: hypothetical protein GY749_41115 [Desulfobacteraceae bacterium]|nr:hypothetical protein [Desulfobacteraceae bacterium]